MLAKEIIGNIMNDKSNNNKKKPPPKLFGGGGESEIAQRRCADWVSATQPFY